jgi:hypothetical protein
MKRFVEGLDRGQETLFPETLDDFGEQENPVRGVIEAFVEALDLGEMGFNGVDSKATGRPSYHPLGSSEALHLRLSEPGAVEPPS